MFGKLDAAQINTVLKRQLVGRIGCHSDGVTYVVPIAYYYGQDCIYGHTGEGMKIEMMRKNPKVCFQVDNMVDISNWESVIVQGEFEEVTDVREKYRALQELLRRGLRMITSDKLEVSPDWPFPPVDLESIGGIVYRIRVHEISGRFERTY